MSSFKFGGGCGSHTWREEMRHRNPVKLCFFLLSVVLLVAGGCLKQPAEVTEPLPEIVWPKPPERPRIRFIHAVTRPEALRITEGPFKRFLRYLGGRGKASMVAPYGIETDSAGRLYVVDTFLMAVHVFDRPKNRYYTFPKGGTTLVSPIDIAIDNERGTIYLTDSKEGVVKIFKNGGRDFFGEIGRGLFERPTGIAINEKTSELLVVDTVGASIFRYALDGRHLKGVFGGNGREEGKFHYPTNVWAKRDGTILVSDSLNFRIQVFSPEGTFLRTFGSAGDSPGYFSRPRGVASDSDGNIYVVDGLFDNVQVFDGEGRLLMAFGGPGHGPGEFWLPTGIFIDKNDTIYVADSYNKRVQIFQYLKGDRLLDQ